MVLGYVSTTWSVRYMQGSGTQLRTPRPFKIGAKDAITDFKRASVTCRMSHVQLPMVLKHGRGVSQYESENYPHTAGPHQGLPSLNR